MLLNLNKFSVLKKMNKITIKILQEFLYFYGINFDIFSHTVRIVFAALYIIIMILAAMLNFTILFVFITRKKLRKPSNIVLSPLLWNNFILLLFILPLTLVTISLEPLRTNRNLVAVNSYLTFFYIWLNFASVMHIGLNRARLIKKNSFRPNQKYHRIDIILLIAAPIWSAVAPLFMVLTYDYQGPEALAIFTFLQFTFLSCAAIVSYAIIIRKVKKSNRKLKHFHQSSILQRQQKRRLRKVNHTVTFVIGGYILTFTPFLGVLINEVYNIYNKEFMQKHLLFMYVFRTVADIMIYLSSIINPFIYFYIQSDIRDEIEKLSFVKCVSTAVRSC